MRRQNACCTSNLTSDEQNANEKSDNNNARGFTLSLRFGDRSRAESTTPSPQPQTPLAANHRPT